MTPSAGTGMTITGSRCVVFGGAGFLGSHVAAQLVAEDASVVSVDLEASGPPGADCVCADITDRDDVAAAVAGAEHVFCFAGGIGAVRSLEDPLGDLDTSVRAQVILLECVRDLAPHASVVFAGSRLEYGMPQYLPMDEHHPLGPTSPYAAHKALCSWYYEFYAQTHGLKTTVLRLPNPYGAHVAGSPAKAGYGILNLFVDLAKSGEPIRLFGDGSQLRDFVHVDDVASAAVAASTAPSSGGRALNIGSGTATSLREAADLVVEVCGKGSVVADLPWPNGAATVETGSYSFDISLAREVLGWTPQVDLRHGLERLIRGSD